MVLGGSTTGGVGGVVGVGEGGHRTGRNGVGGDICRGGGFHVPTYFSLTLPIACIEGLQKGSQFSEHGGFSNPHDVIFDTLQQSIIEEPSKCSFPISSQLQSVSVELDNVLVDVVSILHAEVEELGFGIPDRIMGAKVRAEFVCKLLEAVHP